MPGSFQVLYGGGADCSVSVCLALWWRLALHSITHALMPPTRSMAATDRPMIMAMYSLLNPVRNTVYLWTYVCLGENKQECVNVTIYNIDGDLNSESTSIVGFSILLSQVSTLWRTPWRALLSRVGLQPQCWFKYWVNQVQVQVTWLWWSRLWPREMFYMLETANFLVLTAEQKQ